MARYLLLSLVLASLYSHGGAQMQNIAFTAIATRFQGPEQNDTVIMYDYIETNHGSGFSASTGQFTAPSAGLYKFYWSSGATSESFPVQTALFHNGSPVVASYEAEDSFSQSANTGYLLLASGDTVYVVLKQGSRTRGTPYTTFSGHFLQSQRGEFFATRSNAFGPNELAEGIVYDNIGINEGSYDFVQGIYSAPKDGVYAFEWAFSTADETNLASVSILRNNVPYMTAFEAAGTRATTSDNSVLIPLIRGDQVQMVLADRGAIGNGGAAFNSATSAFSGRMVVDLTPPLNGTGEVIFSAYTESNTQTGVVIWDEQFINLGGGYDTRRGFFTAPVNGTYAFYFSANGNNQQNPAELFLYLNNNLVVRSHESHFDLSNVSNMVILDLSVADRVHVEVEGVIGSGPGANRSNSFVGILLFT